MKILCFRWCILCLGVVEVTWLAEYFVPFSFLLHKTTLCVILMRPLDLSSTFLFFLFCDPSSALSTLWLARCKSLCWHRAMKKWLGIECCLLSGACTFLRKKYSYLDVAPEPLAFRNEELEGLLEFSFGWLVLASSAGSSVFSAILLSAGMLRHVFSHFAFCFVKTTRWKSWQDMLWMNIIFIDHEYKLIHMLSKNIVLRRLWTLVPCGLHICFFLSCFYA